MANVENENRQERLEVNNQTRDETRVKAARQDNSIANETDDVEAVGLSKNMDANFSSALPDKNPRVGSDFQVTLPPVQKEMDSTFMNKFSQIDFSKRQNIFDSLAEYGQGVSIVIRKGTLVWVCADSLIGD